MAARKPRVTRPKQERGHHPLIPTRIDIHHHVDMRLVIEQQDEVPQSTYDKIKAIKANLDNNFLTKETL